MYGGSAYGHGINTVRGASAEAIARLVARDRGTADIRSRHSMAGMTVGKLVLRAYRQSETDRNLRLKCLDLFDRLIASGTYGAEQALESWDGG